MARGGYLKASDVSDAIVAKSQALDLIARRLGQTLAGMALAWVLRNPAVTSVIVGASSVSQLDANLKAMSRPDFSAEELAEIDAIVAG